MWKNPPFLSPVNGLFSSPIIVHVVADTLSPPVRPYRRSTFPSPTPFTASFVILDSNVTPFPCIYPCLPSRSQLPSGLVFSVPRIQLFSALFSSSFFFFFFFLGCLREMIVWDPREALAFVLTRFSYFYSLFFFRRDTFLYSCRL